MLYSDTFYDNMKLVTANELLNMEDEDSESVGDDLNISFSPMDYCENAAVEEHSSNYVKRGSILEKQKFVKRSPKEPSESYDGNQNQKRKRR